MKEVTQEEFFAALRRSAIRDPMPTPFPDRSEWHENKGAGALWGITRPGFRNPGDPETFWLVEAQP